MMIDNTSSSSFSSWHSRIGKVSLVNSVANSISQAQEAVALKRRLAEQIDSVAGVFTVMEAAELRLWAQHLCADLGFRLPETAIITDVRSIIPVIVANAPTLLFRAADATTTLAIVSRNLLAGAETAKALIIQQARDHVGDGKLRQAMAHALTIDPATLDPALDLLAATAFSHNTLVPLSRKLVALRQTLPGNKTT